MDAIHVACVCEDLLMVVDVQGEHKTIVYMKSLYCQMDHIEDVQRFTRLTHTESILQLWIVNCMGAVYGLHAENIWLKPKRGLIMDQ